MSWWKWLEFIKTPGGGVVVALVLGAVVLLFLRKRWRAGRNKAAGDRNQAAMLCGHGASKLKFCRKCAEVDFKEHADAKQAEKEKHPWLYGAIPEDPARVEQWKRLLQNMRSRNVYVRQPELDAQPVLFRKDSQVTFRSDGGRRYARIDMRIACDEAALFNAPFGAMVENFFARHLDAIGGTWVLAAEERKERNFMERVWTISRTYEEAVTGCCFACQASRSSMDFYQPCSHTRTRTR